MDKQKLNERFDYWIKKLRIKGHWDIELELIEDPTFNKTGDFKIDPDDKKAVLMLNANNPHQLNLEEVIVHELFHIKLYPLDQVTENLIESHYQSDTGAYRFAYSEFMGALEQTVAELAKCFLLAYGEDKNLSYGRAKNTKSFNDLYEGLKSYNYGE
ncbi:MAG: hypothetical protein ACLFPM_04750 [Candidatus Izemoplasmatales bacterium]